MGVRYRCEFYSTEGTLWKIDVHDSSHSGAITDFVCTPPFFSLSYNGGNQRFDPIIGSELKVFSLVQDAAFETFIDDIIGAGENRFNVVLYKNSTFYWAGSLIQDNIKKEDTYYPYEFEMSFVDGLGTLKDQLFWDTTGRVGALYTGKESIIQIIWKCITKAGAGVGGNTTFWTATDTFISTCVHWYETRQNFYANSDPLLYTRVSHKTFYDEQDGVYKPMSAYDVLYNLLSLFGARIMLSNGKYLIMQVNEHICTNQLWRTYRVTDGAYLAYSFEANMIDTPDYDVLAGRSYTYMPGLLKAAKKYKYRASGIGFNLLPKKNSYKTETSLIGDIIGGGNETLWFNGTLVEKFVVPTVQFWNTPYRAKYKLTLKITNSVGTVNYLKRTLMSGLPVNVDGYTYEWTATPSYIIVYGSWVNQVTTTDVKGVDFDFMTTVIPWDCTGTFKFEFDSFVTNSGNPTTPNNLTFSFSCSNFVIQEVFPETILTSGTLIIGHSYRINSYQTGDDFTNVGGTNATDAEFTATGETPLEWSYGSELQDLSSPTAEGEVEFLATSTLTGRTKVYQAKDTLIGDGYNKLSIGALECSNGSTWDVSTLWSLKKDATTKTIHQLFVNEVISGQLTPVTLMNASFISPALRADRSIILADDTIWAMMNATLSGNNDLWTGEWFKMQNMTVVEEDQIFLASGVFSEDYLWTNQAWVSETYNEDGSNIPQTLTGNNASVTAIGSSSLKEITSTDTITSDTTLTLSSGNMLTLIVIKNVNGPMTLKIGLTNGGGEIFEDYLDSLEIRSLPLHLVMSDTSDTTIYVTSSDWDEITLFMKQETVF